MHTLLRLSPYFADLGFGTSHCKTQQPSTAGLAVAHDNGWQTREWVSPLKPNTRGALGYVGGGGGGGGGAQGGAE